MGEKVSENDFVPVPRRKMTPVRIVITVAAVVVIGGGSFVGTQLFLHNNPFTSTHSADCKSAEASLLVVTAAMQSVGSSDPAAVIKKLDSLASTLDSTAKKLADSEVKKSVTSADDSLKTITATLKSMADDPASADMATLTSQLDATEDAFQAIDQVCK